MRVHFHTDLRCAAADAPTTASFLAARLVGREDEVITPIRTVFRSDGLVSVTYEGWLLLSSAAAAFLTEIQDRWTQGPAANRLLEGSTVKWHECLHDELTPDCSTAVGGFAQKGNFA